MKPSLGAVANLTNRAISTVRESAPHTPGAAPTVVDLGCGDGELLAMLRAISDPCYPIGVDRDPAHREAWLHRKVLAIHANFLDLIERSILPRGDVYVLANTLEYIAEPGALLSVLARQPGARFLVAASPLDDAPRVYGQGRGTLWRWPLPEYARLVRSSGWPIVMEHRLVPGDDPGVTYQIILAERNAS
jgi:SAM-dependent methyltransferase